MKAFSLIRNHQPTAKEALREAIAVLQNARIESASLDARLLLEYALGVSHEQLLFMFESPLSAAQEERYRQAIAQRACRKPVSQIVGGREFWSMHFAVTEATLDPRPDSETLIEAVLRQYPDRQAGLRILDLGTGTGCLLLSLLKEYPNATGVGVDISEAALAVAEENAHTHELQHRSRFLCSRWFDAVEGQFDLIISNPPYIPSASIASLAPEVAQYEPKAALDGGADGLDCYRAIIAAAPAFLAPGGTLIFEIGAGQLASLEALLAASPSLHFAGARNDLHGLPRAVLATLTQ